MIRYNIKNNFGIIEFAQFGVEIDGKFSGLYIYRNLITYINDNEGIKSAELEKTLKENEGYAKIVTDIKAVMNELKIAFNDKRKKFIIQLTTDKEIVQSEFTNNFYEKSVIGNTEISKEEKVKMIKEDVVYLINDVTNILKILKATDEKEFETFTKQMNLTINA